MLHQYTYGLLLALEVRGACAQGPSCPFAALSCTCSPWTGEIAECPAGVVPPETVSLHTGEAGARSSYRPDDCTGQQLVQEPQAEGPHHGHHQVSHDTAARPLGNLVLILEQIFL